MDPSKPTVQSGMSRGIAIDPRVKNPKAHEMHALATSFVRDAEQIQNQGSTARLISQIHGIEMALKAWLHENGISIDDLKKYRHDLNTLLSEAKAKGLKLSESDAESVIDRLNTANEAAALRYDYAYHNIPLYTDITRVANSIVNDTKLPLPPLK